MSKCKVIASVNYKGGVGKSTLIILLSRFLAKLGLRVLLIDCDGQNSSTFHFVQNSALIGDKSLFRVYTDNNIRANIHKTDRGVDIIASSFYLNKLRSLPNNVLHRLFEDSGIKEDYDFILIDTPPNLDVFCYSSALVADKIIMPYTLGEFDIKTTANTFQMVMETLDKEPEDFIAIANIVDGPITGGEDNLNTQFVGMAKTFFPQCFSEFYIPKSKPLKKTMARGEILSAAQNKEKVFNALCDVFEHLTGCARPSSF